MKEDNICTISADERLRYAMKRRGNGGVFSGSLELSLVLLHSYTKSLSSYLFIIIGMNALIVQHPLQSPSMLMLRPLARGRLQRSMNSRHICAPVRGSLRKDLGCFVNRD
jgi:hypothetical protein